MYTFVHVYLYICVCAFYINVVVVQSSELVSVKTLKFARSIEIFSHGTEKARGSERRKSNSNIRGATKKKPKGCCIKAGGV